jgi:DNA-binding MarR family transcriptional regulator
MPGESGAFSNPRLGVSIEILGGTGSPAFAGDDGHLQMATSHNDPLEELYRRPGFMIRRVHQIAVSLFIEETGKLGVTNRQYGILFVLKHRPGIDQISVANLLGLDRSTTGMVLKKLEEDGLVGRSIGAHDRRRHSLQLTRSGEKLLLQLAEPARKAHARVLSAFTPREQTLFLQLLDKFMRAFNDSTRVPLDPHRTSGKALAGLRRANEVRSRTVRAGPVRRIG